MEDSIIDLHSPVSQDRDGEQDHLLAGTRPAVFQNRRIQANWIRIAKVSGVLMLIALLGGVIGLVSFPRTVSPVIPPNTTTTTQKPTTPTTILTTTIITSTTILTTTTTTELPTSTPKTTITTTATSTTTHNPDPPGPFPPPTKRPLPPHPETLPPITLLYDMEQDPSSIKFAEVPCQFAKPQVFRFNVTVADHTFSCQGGDSKKEAKTCTAMVANEALFQFKYPSIPVPHSKCLEVSSETVEKEEIMPEL